MWTWGTYSLKRPPAKIIKISVPSCARAVWSSCAQVWYSSLLGCLCYGPVMRFGWRVGPGFVWSGTIWQIGDLGEPRIQVQPPGPTAGCKSSSRVKTFFVIGRLLALAQTGSDLWWLSIWSSSSLGCSVHMPRDIIGPFLLSPAWAERSLSLERICFTMERFFTSSSASTTPSKLCNCVDKHICNLLHHSVLFMHWIKIFILI